MVSGLRPLRVAALVTAVALLAMSPYSSAGDEGESRTETRRYVGGAFSGYTAGLCVAEVEYAVGCFGLEHGDGHVATSVTDVSGLPVIGWYAFVDADGRAMVGLVGYCDNFESPVPEGAATLRVTVSLHVGNGPCGGGTGATTGVVTARFSAG